MKLFKTTDDKLLDIGFKKVRQNDFGAGYERTEPEGYTHVVDLVHKKSERHLIQSYSKGEFGPNYTNACVGLTYHEAKLFLRKMREIGLYDRRR